MDWSKGGQRECHCHSVLGATSAGVRKPLPYIYAVVTVGPFTVQLLLFRGSGRGWSSQDSIGMCDTGSAEALKDDFFYLLLHFS